ncbi:hypothetical protein NXS19_007088 [Fusarium pseudograminearum]|nr:hypothetical protein NXS19_007088 [Fusarium pseudograminearum]
MPRRRKRSKEGPLWSMYPDLHDQVADKLEEVQLDYTFNPNDDDLLALESYDTNIMGTFACNNQKCTKTGWKSMVIAITIRQYSRDRYNARVYHQRCNNCKSIGKPTLDEVSSKGPHEDDLCEGCKAGHCEKGSKKRSNDDAWD